MAKQAKETEPLTIAVGKPAIMNTFEVESALHRLGAREFYTEAGNTMGQIEDIIHETNCEKIIAVGGDGTLNVTFNAVMRSKRPIVVVPMPYGSGNAALWNFNILEKKLPSQQERLTQSMRVINEGYMEDIDLLHITDGTKERYATWVSLGFSADIVDRRVLSGTSGYVGPALEALCTNDAYWLRNLREPTKIRLSKLIPPIYRCPLVAMFSANVKYFGRAIMMSHFAAPGTISTSLFLHTPINGVLALALTYFFKKPIASEYMSSETVHISTKERVECDGELLFEKGPKEIDISLVRKAVRMVVGKGGAEIRTLGYSGCSRTR